MFLLDFGRENTNLLPSHMKRMTSCLVMIHVEQCYDLKVLELLPYNEGNYVIDSV
jgi:hypothetical protein